MEAKTETKNAVNQPQKLKRKMNIQGFINSPWLFLVAPVLLGGFYLINHPQYVVVAMQYPYALASIVAIIPVVFTVRLIISFFSVIEKWIKLQFERAKQAKKGYFFEIVTAVFMFVSICEAGPFFNDIQHNVLGGALGYITVFAFDLIAVVCIDARRKEKAKGGSMAGIYLLGVLLCAAVSMVANLYSALNNFHGPADPTFPGFLKSLAPYVGIMFPIMIVFLAFSRDAEIEIDDAEAYRKQQQKRVDFLSVRCEILASITREMEGIELLKQREFFLKSWLFTKAKMNLVVEIVTGKVQENIEGLRKELDEKNKIIREQVDTAKQLVEESKKQQETIASQLEQLVNFQAKMEASYSNFQTEIQQKFQEELVSFRSDFAQEIDVLSSDFQAKMEEQKRNFSSKIGQEISNFQFNFAQKISEKDTNPEMSSVQKTRITQPLISSENGQKTDEGEDKKLIGLTYQDAVKLLPCQRKQIKVSDLRTAVKRGDLKEKSDGSLARSAVENWAKNFNREEKVS